MHYMPAQSPKPPRTRQPQLHRRAAERLGTATRASLGYVPAPLASRRRPDTSLEGMATPDQQRGMSAFWWDGAFASISEVALINYLAVYLLAFGGSTAQVGLLASLTALSSAVALFPGARFIEVRGQRKATVVVCGGIASRVALLSFAFVPFVAGGSTAVWIVIGLACVRAFFSFFGLPAWTSLAADVVPIGLRGRFFASRSLGMGMAALAAAPVAGWIIQQFGGLHGWQLVWVLSAGAGAVSAYFYARIPEPPYVRPDHAADEGGGASGMLSDVLSDRNFLLCLASVGVWNGALQVAGPFFNVYLVEKLDASTLWVGILAAIPSLTGLFGLRYFGTLMDRAGTRPVLMVTGLLIPVLPLAWMVVSAPWQVILINTLGGILWAGYYLANSNVVMVMATPSKRARYTAAFQTMTFAASFVAPLAGGWLIGIVGFRLIFLLSAVGRLAGTALLLRVRIPARGEAAG